MTAFQKKIDSDRNVAYSEILIAILARRNIHTLNFSDIATSRQINKSNVEIIWRYCHKKDFKKFWHSTFTDLSCHGSACHVSTGAPPCDFLKKRKKKNMQFIS